MIYIVAGNFQQCQYYARNKGLKPSEYRYVVGPESLRGVKDINIIFVGTYCRRSNIYDIMDEVYSLRSCGRVNHIEYFI
jgi:hypothetical protein